MALIKTDWIVNYEEFSECLVGIHYFAMKTLFF